ncbi:uncharacterized protein [Rutidosis leptorrhynchoides]|uniref:uncharacterized protein n=1 Tax=Rutidosis leptorrhynchoides TaxID=125765 RepID=UPI003A999462
MGLKKTILDFFTKTSGVLDNQPSHEKVDDVTIDANNTESQPDDDNITEESPTIDVEKNDNSKPKEFKLDSLVRDPGIRPSIMEYPSNHRDDIRREYIKLGPYQLHKSNYPLSASGSKGVINERPNSVNQGNFLELLKFIASYNKEVENLVLHNAPQNATYTSPYLQLALVAASKEVVEVRKFFTNMNFIINVIDSSAKRHDQLQDAQLFEISHLADIGELQSGRGTNQLQSLQRPGDTRSSLHYRSIRSLLRLYDPAIIVLRDITINGSTSSQKGDASFALTHLMLFDSQLQELNSRFNESVTELLQLSVALDPRRLFNKTDICNLAKKLYPLDFTEQENIQIKNELQHYEIDVPNHPQLKKARMIAELCRGLQETGKNEVYPLLDRLLHEKYGLA